MDKRERCQRRFLEKIFPKNVNRMKTPRFPVDQEYEGPCSDPMREVDFRDGLPIPCGDDLLVNPFHS